MIIPTPGKQRLCCNPSCPSFRNASPHAQARSPNRHHRQWMADSSSPQRAMQVALTRDKTGARRASMALWTRTSMQAEYSAASNPNLPPTATGSRWWGAAEALLVLAFPSSRPSVLPCGSNSTCMSE